jgi:glutathione synthase/RimK-type ligase-like ATP-grasp enzyme
MRLAIHNSKSGFHPRWAAYCEENNISYKLVNCHANDIIMQLQGCDALMWHHGQSNSKDIVIAKQILFALEHSGFKVFPDFKTSWHFDDKVAQKYLLEIIDAPMVKSYAFYEKKEALNWAETTTFPKVFKLRGGAGSANVKLAKTKTQAVHLINTAFGQGFRQYDKWQNLKDRVQKYKSGKTSFLDVIKGVARLNVEPDFSKTIGSERDYVYFQDFMPNQDSDTRIIVVGERAFALKRMVREGDFRASGSGEFYYERELFDERCVQISFEINKKIKSQSLVLDFIFDEHETPLVIELSYGFTARPYDDCPGFWDNDLNWHQGKFNPQGWMVENLIKSVNNSEE